MHETEPLEPYPYPGECAPASREALRAIDAEPDSGERESLLTSKLPQPYDPSQGHEPGGPHPAQAPSLLRTPAGNLRASGDDGPQAAIRCRPFSRRLFRRLRPFFVFIRTRKPCVFFLCLLFGWYVRFILTYSV